MWHLVGFSYPHYICAVLPSVAHSSPYPLSIVYVTVIWYLWSVVHWGFQCLNVRQPRLVGLNWILYFWQVYRCEFVYSSYNRPFSIIMLTTMKTPWWWHVWRVIACRRNGKRVKNTSVNVKLIIQTNHLTIHGAYSIEIVGRKLSTEDNSKWNIFFDISLYWTFCGLGNHTFWISLIGKVALLVTFFFSMDGGCDWIVL